MVGRLVSFWEGPFSGAILVLGRVVVHLLWLTFVGESDPLSSLEVGGKRTILPTKYGGGNKLLTG